MVPMFRTETAASDRSEVTLTEGEEHPNPLGHEATPEASDEKDVYVPQLSWFMTVFVLSVVSVVRTKSTPPRKPEFKSAPLQLVAVTADWLVATANEISVTKYISKEWTALILLPTVRAVAGTRVASQK